jgi:hypothetical protein
MLGIRVLVLVSVKWRLKLPRIVPSAAQAATQLLEVIEWRSREFE